MKGMLDGARKITVSGALDKKACERSMDDVEIRSALPLELALSTTEYTWAGLYSDDAYDYS